VSVKIDKFQGGRQWMVGGGIAGLVLLLVTFLASMGNPQQAMFSYLVAFAYWAGVAMASLVMLMIFHAFKAKWMVVLRRTVEAMAGSIPIFVVLFIPIAAAMKHLYIWVHPPHDLGHEALKILHHKEGYLNVTAFLIRTGIYFLLWIGLSQAFYRWSTRQDQSGALNLTSKQRALGAGGLPFIALTFSFAAFDWLMSLNPLWFSTIFGVYFFAGSFLAAVSLLAIVTDVARGKDQFGEYVSVDHTHSIGKLMLTFTAFWGYIGFSQFMLIWIASLPEEVPFYIVRMKREWAWLGVFLIVGHFFIPFSALLSRSLKRDRRKLAAVGVWILLVHYLDLYWLVMPTLHPEGFSFHWTSVTAFLGVGLVAIAFAVWRLRGYYAIPIKDPYLADSLRYRP
jgi:hypothetical protein